MDTCALLMVGFKGVRTFRARLAFSTARQAVIEMGRVFQVGALPIYEDRLPPQRYERLHREFAEAGLQFADDADSEQKLAEFRNTYEPFPNGLAHYLVLSVPDWLPMGDPLDNWQNNPRGKSAKKLIDSVPAKPEQETPRLRIQTSTPGNVNWLSTPGIGRAIGRRSIRMSIFRPGKLSGPAVDVLCH